MANTNVTAISFSNNKARPMADSMAKLYYQCKDIVNTWNATGMSTNIPNDTTVLSDGAAVDGRNPVTNANVTSIITRAQEFITDYEATSSAKLNTVLVVAVNTK
jgi:hypothetical protein